AFEFDGDARAAPQGVVMMRLLIHFRIVGHPFDSAIGNVLLSFFTRRDVFTVALAIDDFRLVAPRVDLNFEIVRRLSRRSHRDNLHRLAGGQHSIHPGGADTDSLLAAAHSKPVKLGTVEKLPED